MKKQETTSRLENILKNAKTEDDIRNYIKGHAEQSYADLGAYFNEYIGEHDLLLPDILAKSNISKNYIYNILNGNRNPSRDKIIALGISAGMSCEEINRGLKIAQKGVLYVKNERDAYIITAVNRGVTSVTELNIILSEANLPILE